MNSRQEKRLRKKKKQKNLSILLVAVVVVLGISYIMACRSVKDDLIIGTTTVNGVDVSGMTQEEAKDAIMKGFQDQFGKKTVAVNALKKKYDVAIYESLSMDCEEAAKEAYSHGHGSFLTRGMGLLKAELFHNKLTKYPVVANQEALQAAIHNAGLMDVNTTVQTTYEVVGKTIVFTKGVTGESVDLDALTKKLTKAVNAADYDSVVACPMLTGAVADLDVQAVYDSIHTEKTNATLNPKKNYKVVKSVKGVSFDVESTRISLENASEGEKVEVNLLIEKPDITTKKLKKHLFKDVLGTCTTDVGGTSTRISNVALAAKKLNGKILLPGETFSYNDTVGKRTEENGFGKAPAYSNGVTVQEIGGGICQVSSTLYKATVLSNLKIVDRTNHTYVSNYIGLGQDATVSWGSPDYKFKNNTDYPIKISAKYEGGQVTCKIYGANIKKQHVKIRTETLKTIDYSTITEEDSSMVKGDTAVSVTGETGYVVQTYREVYNKKGKLISSKKEAKSTYSKRDRVVRVGTAEPATTESTEDTGAADTSEGSEATGGSDTSQ